MKKSRKKILLSSIAMLLVALVALGSATFAWFTINKTVEANGISVKATVAKGLEITSTNGKAWGRTATFGQTTAADLKPVSLVPAGLTTATNGYVAGDVGISGGGVWSAAGDDVGNFTTEALPTPPDANIGSSATDYKVTTNSYFAIYRIGIKSSDGQNIGQKVDAAITVTDADTTDDIDTTGFVKAALYTGDLSTTAATVQAMYGDGYNAITAASPISTTPVAAGTGSKTAILNNIGAAQYFTLVVWYEGNDTNCVDANQLGVSNIAVSFTLNGASS